MNVGFSVCFLLFVYLLIKRLIQHIFISSYTRFEEMPNGLQTGFDTSTERHCNIYFKI